MVVDPQPPPQGGGTRGGAEAPADDKGKGEGAGGGAASTAAQPVGRTYRAPDSDAGKAARDLVATAREVGTAAELHAATKARLGAAQKRQPAGATPAEQGAGGGSASPDEPQRGGGTPARPDANDVKTLCEAPRGPRANGRSS